MIGLLFTIGALLLVIAGHWLLGVLVILVMIGMECDE